MYEGCFIQTRLSKAPKVSVDQKTRPRIYFKTCGWAFETLSQAFETLLRVQEKTKSLAESFESSAECLKSSAMCLYYNRAHAFPISHRSHHSFPQFDFCHCGLTQYPKNIYLDTPEYGKSKFTVRPTYTLMIRRFCKRSSVIEMSIIQVIKH